MNEDDVRLKIVYQLLTNSVVSLNEIHLEKNIKIQLGRRIENLRGRADILITNKNGDILLVIEVKAPNHSITQNDINQGLSYAKLIVGNIAPITVITNGEGNETNIYDTITSKKLNELPKNILDSLTYQQLPSEIEKLRESALSLLCETKSSLLFESFFEEYWKQNTSHLIGGMSSGKKYVEQLYVHLNICISDLREKEKEKEKEKTKLFLVRGEPQSGKTNYMLNSSDQIRKIGHSVFFRHLVYKQT